MGNAFRQEALLHALEPGLCLSISELAEKTGVCRKGVVASACALVERGFIERRAVGCYQLGTRGKQALEQGLEISSGPRGPLGKPRTTPRNSFRLRLWRVMNVKRSFTVPELVGIAGAGTEDNARLFVNQLLAIGYLQRSRARVQGTKLSSNGFKLYRVIKHTGPQPPAFQARKRRVFDPNTGETFNV